MPFGKGAYGGIGPPHIFLVSEFASFNTPAVSGQITPAAARLGWLEPSAQLDLWVREASGALIDSDMTLAGSPKWLVLPAGDGGNL